MLLWDKEPNAPKLGEVIYRDDLETVCRRWNWREADRTKLTNETKNAILVIEALEPTTKEELQQALNELTELVEKHCNATTKIEILNQQNITIDV